MPGALTMYRYLFCVLAFLLATSAAKSQELRIGFLNTTSGGLAIAGEHLERGWRLGLEARGWKKDGDRVSNSKSKKNGGPRIKVHLRILG